MIAPRVALRAVKIVAKVVVIIVLRAVVIVVVRAAVVVEMHLEFQSLESILLHRSLL
uniref:Uncharacterized protein n=1 Tax=Promethearchaeum syntrophicum TaxID=2594042 RepID=A0A5B9DDK9_9ARCH|nr:hypothetical protein DSAG12_02690 [Candidatus Prometheoarchaeum syntrophicum]